MLAKQQKIEVIDRSHPSFPSLLRETKDCPDQLYITGKFPAPDRPLLTVVGTRRASTYGKRALEAIVKPLVLQGFGIISGLAFGIDALAHELCLNLGGYTAGIIASGLNKVTPVEHIHLARRIIESGGAMISEMPPDAPIQHKGAYPRRNRLLAGISPMTLVIEAAQKSGAQITAHLAADYGRDVGVVPGSIFSDVSIGCHSLLKKGAFPITRAEDVLEIYHLIEEKTFQPALPTLSKDEQAAWAMIKTEPQSVDTLHKQIPGSLSQLLVILTQLEIKGVIKQIPGQGYARS